MKLTDTTTSVPTGGAATGERADLLATLTAHRDFLRQTVRGLTDEQARQRTTVSELCLGGLIKHVAAIESQWVDFIEGGPAAMAGAFDSELEWARQFQLLPAETVAEVLDRYDVVARRTDALVSSLPDLDVSHPLPPAPWFEPGARRSARRVFLHIIAETAQHAGHADIIRESLDPPAHARSPLHAQLGPDRRRQAAGDGLSQRGRARRLSNRPAVGRPGIGRFRDDDDRQHPPSPHRLSTRPKTGSGRSGSRTDSGTMCHGGCVLHVEVRGRLHG